MTDQNNKKEPIDLTKVRERPFTVSLYSIYKTYNQLTNEAPVKIFQAAARKTDDMTKSMMTGYAAAVTMPLGIIIRNGARVAHNATEGNNGYSITAAVGGVAGAGAAWWIAGSAALAALSASAATGTLGAIGVGIAATVLTAPIITPAFTVALFASAALLGTAASAISVLGAIKNLDIGYARSVHAFRGVKYSAEELKDIESGFNKDSLTIARQNRMMQDVQHTLHSLRDEQRVALNKYMGEHFKEVADHQAQAGKTNVVALSQKPGSGPRPV